MAIDSQFGISDTREQFCAVFTRQEWGMPALIRAAAILPSDAYSLFQFYSPFYLQQRVQARATG